jgi:hypothetical protein
MIGIYIILGVALIYILSSYLIHILMSLDSSYNKGWATFKDFMYQFNKYDDWKCDETERNRIYTITRLLDSYDSAGNLHASMIRINDHIMIMKNPYEWLKFVIWNTRYYNKHTSPTIQKIDWSKV